MLKLLKHIDTYNHKKYFYIVNKDIEVFTDLLICESFSNEWIKINNGQITIKKGYAFNGASPRFELFGCEWGTPQGRGLVGMIGFCVHDALWQFGKEIGISKSLSNKIQLELHKKHNFKPAKLYYYVLQFITIFKK